MNISNKLDRHLSTGSYFSFMTDLSREHGKEITHGDNFQRPLRDTTEKTKAEQNMTATDSISGHRRNHLDLDTYSQGSESDAVSGVPEFPGISIKK